MPLFLKEKRMSKSNYVEFAQVRQGQDGSTYIKIMEEVSLKPGMSIYKDTPQAKLENLLKLGFITDEQLEERLAKIPDYILQILTVKLG